jgi:hypothetical protein
MLAVFKPKLGLAQVGFLETQTLAHRGPQLSLMLL